MEALLRAGLVAGSELVDVDRGAAIYSFHRARQQELQMSLCHPSGQASIHLVEAERETVKLTAPLEHGRWEACGADDGCGSWSRHGSLLECPPQHVIKVGVTCVAASTLGTGETVVAQSISRTTAELAVVRFTYRCPESQRHCYPDGFVLQVESQTGDWEGLHPGGGFFCRPKGPLPVTENPLPAWRGFASAALKAPHTSVTAPHQRL
ncbi:hypothetical protein FJT64_019701 [Amphibalanus amphitrite]|uniref:Uncharacterized protein n=1 Tax=Amphibalanus amphitrite TaxID=1232801 RepID=A0A6A4WI05_AMPAM|nr:hypothetical protein FJT64_027501 [Amphibalanus amphitrite]KAF0301551.1 hypothetical protein FJT64_026186 [Amphibalanus amphitrite]KAF0309140.1 hypothetical protein FJT64_019701 [Amphibalanus amphitrite]